MPESSKKQEINLSSQRVAVVDDDFLRPHDVIRFVRRWFKLILVLSLSGLVIGALIWKKRPTTYVSEVPVEITRDATFTTSDPKILKDLTIALFTQSNLAQVFADKFFENLRERGQADQRAKDVLAYCEALFGGQSEGGLSAEQKTAQGFAFYLQNSMVPILQGTRSAVAGKFGFELDPGSAQSATMFRLTLRSNRRGIAVPWAAATIGAFNFVARQFNDQEQSRLTKIKSRQVDVARVNYEQAQEAFLREKRTYDLRRNVLLIEFYRIEREIAISEKKAGIKEVPPSNAALILNLNDKEPVPDTGVHLEKSQFGKLAALDVFTIGKRLGQLSMAKAISQEQEERFTRKLAQVETDQGELQARSLPVFNNFKATEIALTQTMQEAAAFQPVNLLPSLSLNEPLVSSLEDSGTYDIPQGTLSSSALVGAIVGFMIAIGYIVVRHLLATSTATPR